MKSLDRTTARIRYNALCLYASAVAMVEAPKDPPDPSLTQVMFGHDSVVLAQTSSSDGEFGAVFYLKIHNVETTGIPRTVWVHSADWQFPVTEEGSVTIMTDEGLGTDGGVMPRIRAVRVSQWVLKHEQRIERATQHPLETSPDTIRAVSRYGYRVPDLEHLASAFQFLRIGDGTFTISAIAPGYLALRHHSLDLTMAAILPPAAK